MILKTINVFANPSQSYSASSLSVRIENKIIFLGEYLKCCLRLCVCFYGLLAIFHWIARIQTKPTIQCIYI